MPRTHNKVADGLADLTMDRGSSWTVRYTSNTDIQHGNIIVQTDGGLREGDCAAASFIIGLWVTRDGQTLYEPILAHGTFMDSESTVFLKHVYLDFLY